MCYIISNGGESQFPPLIYKKWLVTTNFCEKARLRQGENMNEVKKSISEYSYSNDTGDAQAVVYHLFPGVEAAYISVHMTDFDFSLFEQGDRKNYVTIHYCREGRIEQQVNDEFFYLMQGIVLLLFTIKNVRCFNCL